MPVLDPDIARILDQARTSGSSPFEALTPAAARSSYAASWDVMQAAAQVVASVQDVTISAAERSLRLRIYRGMGTVATQVLPCVVFLHGGGWMLGNLDSHDRLCRQLANRAQCCVVAVDYRLAPEHPFPAAVHDCADAWRWLHANAESQRVDRCAIGVAGDSAGGNLAAVLALMARDGALPRCKLVAMAYPALDLRAGSASYARVTADVPLTARTMRHFIGLYVPDPVQRSDWRASPALAPSLRGLPMTLVLTVTHDPLCDEGRAFAIRLEEEGVAVTSLHLSNHVHGMLTHGRVVRASVMVSDMFCDWVAVGLRQ